MVLEKAEASLATVQLRPSEMGPTMQEDKRPGVFKPVPKGPDQNVRPESVRPDQDDGQVQFIRPDQDSGPILNFGQAHILGPESLGPCKEVARGPSQEEGASSNLRKSPHFCGQTMGTNRRPKFTSNSGGARVNGGSNLSKGMTKSRGITHQRIEAAIRYDPNETHSPTPLFLDRAPAIRSRGFWVWRGVRGRGQRCL